MRLLYVAITRAREKLILEWPSYAHGKGVTPWSLLAHECKLTLEGRRLAVADAEFEVENFQGTNELPGDLEIGTIAETLSRALGKLKASGVIDVKGAEITILDPAALAEIADG